MHSIVFDREYLMIYQLINFNTGEVLSHGRKRVHELKANFMVEFGKLLVNNLHWKDSVSLQISFCPDQSELTLNFD